MPLAKPWKRYAALLLDMLWWAAPTSLFLLAFGLYPEEGKSSLGYLVFVTGSFLLWLALLAYFDGGDRGATPGKRVLGMRVVDKATGGRIGFRRGAVRRLVFMPGGWCLYIGWLWTLRDRDRQAWHDKAARTIVIDDR